MRILHLINHSGRHNGNVHAAVDLACAEADLGHTVWFCSAGGNFDAVLEAHRVTVIQMPELARRAGSARTVARIRSVLEAHDIDIVHAHMMKSAVAGWLATRFTSARLATTVHNAFEPSAILMGLGDRVIAVSASVGRSMHQRGVPAKRLRVVLNGTIGTARYVGENPEPERLERPAVLYVGGLHPRKGVADLLTGFSMARQRRPDLHLYLVGEGPCEQAYVGSVSDADRGHVHFTGARPDPRSFMLGADVLVLASHADPAPLVIPEARGAGLAVVGTEVDGIPELLEGGQAGSLVPPHAPAAIAGALLSILESDETLAAHRARSQVNIEHLSVRRVAADTLAVYAELLREHAVGRKRPRQVAVQPLAHGPIENG